MTTNNGGSMMKMAEIEAGETYRVYGYRKARVLEKGLPMEWHRHKPKTAVLLEWLEGPHTGRQIIVEGRHLVPVNQEWA